MLQPAVPIHILPAAREAPVVMAVSPPRAGQLVAPAQSLEQKRHELFRFLTEQRLDARSHRADGHRLAPVSH